MDLRVLIVYHNDLNFWYGIFWNHRAKERQYYEKLQQKVISNPTKCTEKLLILLCTTHSKLALQSQPCWAICRMTGNYLHTTFRSKDGHNTQLTQANERQLKPALILSKALPKWKASFTRIPTNLQQQKNHPRTAGLIFYSSIGYITFLVTKVVDIKAE